MSIPFALAAQWLGTRAARHAASLTVSLALLLAGCSDGGAGSTQQASSDGTGSGAHSGGSSGSGGTSLGGSGHGGSGQGDSGGTGGASGTGAASGDAGMPSVAGLGFAVPSQGQVLSATNLAAQLVAYDPGSLLRCEVADDPNYQSAIDALGGVTWGYSVGVLEDQSKPHYLAGVERALRQAPEATGAANDGSAVEIALPDVVAVTESAGLFYSGNHGLMIVALDGSAPEFRCATPLPGRVDQFYFHDGQLVVITKSQNSRDSYLLHFTVKGTALNFVELVALGPVDVLDSRRFNEKLVFYTTLTLDPATPAAPPTTGGGNAGGAAVAPVQAPGQHRALHVYRLGDTLEEELFDTLIDTSQSQDQLFSQVTDATPLGSQIYEARTFGTSLWASDHYFVVTEQISKTFLDAWETQTYPVCTASHTTTTPYTACWTVYETRPNPDYVEPDNSGGDSACHGTTLSDCLVQVARVSNKTIQVPVGKQCEERERTNWFCDSYETRSTTYPLFRNETSTQLYIYEYTDDGFVQIDSKVHEVQNTGLDAAAPDDTVDVITTSVDSYDLAVPGSVQTLYFQNGYLYVISNGVLQVYAMGGASIVRTSTLQVVNESLQSSLFSDDKLYLSDFGWSGGDHSTLRVINLTNPAFPSQDGATHELPGGHRSIIAADAGIFTIGTVAEFMGQSINAIKLGLFSDPYAEETAYSILGTDLSYTSLLDEKTQLFASSSQRLLLPYSGQDDQRNLIQRVGVSRVVPGSIESEGAVVLPEPAVRVRQLPSGDEAYLTFARNSIEWLTPDGQGEWQSAPVLEYFEPFALYPRAPEAVELQRLGTRCRLYFSDPTAINQRPDDAYSDEFACQGYAQAYDNRFILSGTTGIEFAADHTLRDLAADEVTDTLAKIAARPYCLLSLEIVDYPALDPTNLPPLDRFT